MKSKSIDELWEAELKIANNLLNNKKSVTSKKAKFMPHVYDDYTTKEIEAMFEAYETGSFNYNINLAKGEILDAKLKRVTKTDYIFDIGYKDEVYVERKRDEERFLAEYADSSGNLLLDTMVEIQITDIKTDPYLIKGSLSSINLNNVLDEMKECDRTREFNAHVDEMLSAGFNVTVNCDGFKIKGFMPNLLAGINRLNQKELDALNGQDIKVMIESFTEDRGTFIVSRKRYLQSLIPEKISKLVTKNEKGEHLLFKGVVTGTTKFGVFVEFDGLTGMIHVDNMLETTKANFRDLKQGEVIDFYVKDIVDTKLILTQIIKETIWDVIDVKQVYDGIVVCEKSFGYLVRLDEETVGLISKKELDKDKTLSKDAKVKVSVTNVSKKDRKISLSLV